MERGTGQTTRQMERAKKNALFVWCNGNLAYPSLLARNIGRKDLKIVTPYWLESGAWYGLRLSDIIVDHAANLTHRQTEGLSDAMISVLAKRA